MQMATQHRVGVLGTGGMSSAHLCAMDALSYYYADYPELIRVAVASTSSQQREGFARRHRFSVACGVDDIFKRNDIDTFFLLGPNDTHAGQLCAALQVPSVRHVYVEKPVCATSLEEHRLAEMLPTIPAEVIVQSGFQFLQMAPVRRALQLMHASEWGRPIHFHGRYLHGDYRDLSYREQRTRRLQPAPAGGATADLGCHILSLLVAFLGEDLEVVSARQSGSFPDVPLGSDLCAAALLHDASSGAVGTVVASRISAGAGDVLELEIFFEWAALRISTERPDLLELFTRDGANGWRTVRCASDYSPAGTFPSRHVSAGWLRSLIHAQYLLWGGHDPEAIRPDLRHGLIVQRLIRRIAEELDRANQSTRRL